MQITLNGSSESLPGEMSVAELLARLEVDPIRAAVEVNEDLVRRNVYQETVLRDGDRIEVVTFVGGG